MNPLEIQLDHIASFRSQESMLDYQGSRFHRFGVMLGASKIGENVARSRVFSQRIYAGRSQISVGVANRTQPMCCSYSIEVRMTATVTPLAITESHYFRALSDSEKRSNTALFIKAIIPIKVS